MVMVEAEIKKWGNSLGFIIPADAVKTEEFRVGEVIRADLMKPKRINGFGMCKGAPSYVEEDITDF